MPKFRNIVPYKDGEGRIGLPSKKWAELHANVLKADSVVLPSNILNLNAGNMTADFTAGALEDGYGMRYDGSNWAPSAISAGNVLASLSDTDMNYFGGLEAGESLRYSTGGNPDVGWYPYPLHYGHMSQNRVNQTITPIPVGTTWTVNTSPVSNVQYVVLHIIESGDDTAVPSWHSAPGHWINVELSGVQGMTVYQRGSQVRVNFASTIQFLQHTITPSEWTVRIDIHGD